MSFWKDRQLRIFCLFLILALLLSGFVEMALYFRLSGEMKATFLSHDSAVASSLIEQGVPREVIAKAITNTEINGTGTNLLEVLGMTGHTAASLLPFVAGLQKTAMQACFLWIFFLSALVLGGTFFFLHKREQLYQQASIVIQDYCEGDYSSHLPGLNEGAIYRLFASVEQLATMLHSKSETENKARIFLKNTISDISHQLKTPLAALMMYQEIIHNEPDQPKTVKTFSFKMEQSLKRIEQLIQSMLKITRLDAGSIIFEKQKHPVSELVRQSLEGLTIRAEKENKEIILDGAADLMLSCDMEWTREAVGNIVKNALDHTSSGGRICISWEHAPAMVRINIADNGKGIAPEDLHHIFKRFYRSKDAGNMQGVGLGLPLAKSIMEGQGGRISVMSSPGGGTTFMLSF